VFNFNSLFEQNTWKILEKFCGFAKFDKVSVVFVFPYDSLCNFEKIPEKFFVF